MKAKTKLRLVAPTHQNRTMPVRPVNADLRKREYLTPHEIDKLIKAASKSGKPAAHPIRGDELRALRELKRNQEPASPFVFTTERGGPFTTDAVNRLIKR